MNFMNKMKTNKQYKDFKVLKFGGTSVGSAERMKEVARLISDGSRKIVVLSAMSGTTNKLVEISEHLYMKDIEGAREIIDQLEQKYYNETTLLYSEARYKESADRVIRESFDTIRRAGSDIFTRYEEKVILAQGELMSTRMVANYLLQQGIRACILPALDFMKTNKDNHPDQDFITRRLDQLISSMPPAEIYITQGFICRNAYGEIDNLQRGGSDYTASLIGAALGSAEIQIWTDIDGLHNNDPRIVPDTNPVRVLSFEEAAELAYFGAKILHPTCVLPAQKAGIPVRLLNTMAPEAPGTLISDQLGQGKIKAVAAKDNVTTLLIRSRRMLSAFTFIRKVFDTFAGYETGIDMICTSEVGVSVTIDDTTHLTEIIEELEKCATVETTSDMTIIAVVGDFGWETPGTEAAVVNALHGIPLRMISFGGSSHNITFVVSASDKTRALKQLSNDLF